MATSDAQRRAADKYIEKFDDVKVRFNKGTREEVRQFAVEHGYNSLQEFIKSLVKEASGIDV